MKYNFDCRYFTGEKPCEFKQLCEGCDKYNPMGFNILIIKFGAMGDVLRTTPLIEGLKKKHPKSYITWLVDPASNDLLKNNKQIDRILHFSLNSTLTLMVQEFNLLICLEKEVRAVALAEKITAKRKVGFGLTKYGNIRPFTKEAEYAFQLGIFDQLKFFENKKTYQKIIFEAVGLSYKGEKYQLTCSTENDEFANKLFKKLNFNSKDFIIGINAGAGSVFANKAWTLEGYVEVIERLNKQTGLKVLLMGGKSETEINKEIKHKVSGPLYESGNHNLLLQFSSLIKKCDLVICGDTLPMHLAIAHEKHVLALFGPTCPQEIDLYGKGEIIFSPIECAPCYKGTCNIKNHCMKMISVDTVYDKTMQLVEKIGNAKLDSSRSLS